MLVLHLQLSCQRFKKSSTINIRWERCLSFYKCCNCTRRQKYASLKGTHGNILLIHFLGLKKKIPKALLCEHFSLTFEANYKLAPPAFWKPLPQSLYFPTFQASVRPLPLQCCCLPSRRANPPPRLALASRPGSWCSFPFLRHFVFSTYFYQLTFHMYVVLTPSFFCTRIRVDDMYLDITGNQIFVD